MRNLNEFILESIETQIDEGFLQKLKDGIENFVDNPKEYIDEIKKKSEGNKYWGSQFINGNKEELADELEKLNNDEELKKIYKYFKKSDNKHSYGGLGIANEDTINKLLEKLMNDFDCEKTKALAIMNILYVFRNYEINKNASKKSSSSHSSYSSSSSSNSSTNWGAAIGVALAMS